MSHLTAFLPLAAACPWHRALRPGRCPPRTAARTAGRASWPSLRPSGSRHRGSSSRSCRSRCSCRRCRPRRWASGGSRPAGSPSCSAGVRSGGTRWARAGCRRSGRPRGPARGAAVGAAQAFSQLSQRTHSDSSISSTSVASPTPCCSRKEIRLPRGHIGRHRLVRLHARQVLVVELAAHRGVAGHQRGDLVGQQHDGLGGTTARTVAERGGVAPAPSRRHSCRPTHRTAPPRARRACARP
jgi:hypothetical protein